jgi:RNA polymerase-interacting CarD/CdnL/TRCF family regulator
MDFRVGDPVVHCTHGLGQVRAIEERAINNDKALYYEVQIADLSIWVRADEHLKNRLRNPTSASGFRKLFSVLSGPAGKLPDDRRERNLHLQEMLKDGKTESLCRVIRDLTAYRRTRAWNEYDSELMKRVEKLLIREWSFVLSVPPPEAEAELHRLLLRKAN